MDLLNHLFGGWSDKNARIAKNNSPEMTQDTTHKAAHRAIIVTALPVEYHSVRAHLKEISEDQHPQGDVYECGLFCDGEHLWEVAIVEMGMGNPNAAQKTERAISHFSPEVVLFVGVAGGIKDVKIGDVVVATKVYGYHAGKAGDDFETRPEVSLPNYPILERARAESRKSDWLKSLEPPPSQVPNVFLGAIAAGEHLLTSTQSESYKLICNAYNDALAVEMESYGFLKAAQASSGLEALAIRGISDLLEGKAEADKSGSQECASKHAAAFAFEVLAKFTLPEETVRTRNHKFQAVGDGPSINSEEVAKLIDTVHRQADILDRFLPQRDALFNLISSSLSAQGHESGHVPVEGQIWEDEFAATQRSWREEGGYSGKSFTKSVERATLTDIGKIVEKLDTADGIAAEICSQLSVWNNDTALLLAGQLEEHLLGVEGSTFPRLLEYLFLMARVHVIQAEKKDSESPAHIEKANGFLAQIEAHLGVSPDPALSTEMNALKGSIENIQNGAEAALRFLANRDDPFAIRIRLGIYLNNQDVDGAVRLIEGNSPHLRWCDLGVTAYTLAGRRNEALTLVDWANEQDDQSKYRQCVVRLADASLVRALANQERGKNILPQDLCESEQAALQQVLKDIEPVLSTIITSGSVNSELETVAVKIAWQAHHLLGHGDKVETVSRLMSTRTPVPIDVARSVMSGYMTPPPDLPERLREDHPDDLDANILAAVVESHMGQHSKAYQKAKKLLPLADTNEKKEELFKLFQHLWQELDGDVATECEHIARPLVDHHPYLQAMFDAARALRTGNGASALEILDKQKVEDNVYWLQLKGNALMQQGHLSKAVEMFQVAARRTGDPMLLNKTADLAFQAEKVAVAVECYEALIAAQPNNLTARSNLASLYIFHLKDIGKAAVQLEALQKAEPNNLNHTLNLAICLAQLYRPEESLALYDEVCKAENPDIRGVLGKAELFLSMGNPDAACTSLKQFQEVFWDSPDFLLACMNTGYAADDEEFANEALRKIQELRTLGMVDEKDFRLVHTDEAIEIFKKSIKEAKSRKNYIATEVMKGRMPWVYAAQISGDAIYWAYRISTQEIDWIGDDPFNRVNYSIYSTNGFHARENEDGQNALLPIECPQPGTSVVADLSALITLHRLGLLDRAANYFGEILVPQAYLPTVLDDGRKMVLHQRSRQRTAEKISRHISDGCIFTDDRQAGNELTLPIADEYDDSEADRYRLIDIIQPVYEAGLVDDMTYQRFSKVCTKPSSVDEERPALARLQDIVIELLTLETLTSFGLLDAIAKFYHVYVTSDAQAELKQRLEVLHLQEETRAWHFDLWNQIRKDERFRFVQPVVPQEIKNENDDGNYFLAFWSIFAAQNEGIPLLTDDRACQATIMNDQKGSTHLAFGSDAFVLALADSGKLDSYNASDAIMKLMRWRYRFILPSASILKAYAKRFRANPPGHQLQETALYVHDCMRDNGLLGGPENTDLKESMAMRLYLSWLNLLAKWLVDVWIDEDFPNDKATQLTNWCVQEFLPSPPRVLPSNMKARAGLFTSRFLISHILANSFENEKGVSDALKAVQKALKLSDEDYLRIITENLKDLKRAESHSESMAEVVPAMLLKMRNNALRHFEFIDHRTVRVLQNLNLFKDEDLHIGDGIDPAILNDPLHARRQNLSEGPLVHYVTEEDDPKRVVIELPLLFFSERRNIRQIALESFEKMLAKGLFTVTPKTTAILAEHREALLSETSADWRPAAVAVFDAMYDDVLIALRGTKQCLESEPVIEGSLDLYASKVIRPSISSLDSISLPIGNPEKEHAQLERILSEIITGAGNITQLCDAYLDRLGFLPLAPRYSLAAAVEGWLGSTSDAKLWTQIWEWENTKVSPLSRYHACTVFILHPELIPDGKLSVLWNEVLSVVDNPNREEAESHYQVPWTIRRDLTKHYIYHLESHLPENDGGSIACFAWWFAEQVASLFPADADKMNFYHENWVKPASDLSGRIWLAASSPIQRSFLRGMTLTILSPWATALLALMGEEFERLAPEEQKEEVQSRFHEAVVSNAISNLPFPIESPSDATFAFEYPLAQTVWDWAEYKEGEQRNGLQQLVAISRSLGTNTGLYDALRKLDDASQPDQVAVSIALKAKAYTDPTIADGMWEIVSDAEWRKSVLGLTEMQVQGLLIESLSVLQVKNRGNWFWLFPHYLADLCEAEEDEERKRVLFLYVVHASLASDTVSAVHRLLRGEQKAKFVKHVEEYREHIQNMYASYPSWVAGKLRALMASLHVL